MKEECIRYLNILREEYAKEEDEIHLELLYNTELKEFEKQSKIEIMSELSVEKKNIQKSIRWLEETC